MLQSYAGLFCLKILKYVFLYGGETIFHYLSVHGHGSSLCRLCTEHRTMFCPSFGMTMSLDRSAESYGDNPRAALFAYILCQVAIRYRMLDEIVEVIEPAEAERARKTHSLSSIYSTADESLTSA